MRKAGTPKGRVLVLGEDTRSFLSVVRSLGRYGLEVHAAWCSLNSPSLCSRYIRQVHRLPPYIYGSTHWLGPFLDLIREYRFDLVIPCNDSCILPLQCNRGVIEAAGRIYLLSDDVFQICFSKQRTRELAGQLGIPIPRQRIIHSQAELQEAADEFGLPLVLKPDTSVSLSNPFTRRAVSKIWSRSEIAAAIAPGVPAAGICVQENFIGNGVGVEVLCRDGEILTAFQHERVHEPLQGGGSSYRKSVMLHPELLDATKRLMRALCYTGVGMVEFKVNRRTGAWVLIEINGRFWGSLPLSLAAGLDFPRYLYEMICLARRDFPQSYRCGIYARNWLMDLYWFKANLKADHDNPALMTVPITSLAGEIFHVIGLRETSDTFVLDDPAPAFAEIRQFARDRLAPQWRILPRVRQNMRRRAEAAIRHSNSILFLCKGNICRSPFAERSLQTSSRFRCSSAGYYPVIGRPAPDNAVEAARQFGVELGLHRSCVLDDRMVADMGVILIFDREQMLALEANHPEAIRKTHYLGALDPAGPLEISDPYGGDIEAFRNAYLRIRQLLALPIFGQTQVNHV